MRIDKPKSLHRHEKSSDYTPEKIEKLNCLAFQADEAFTAKDFSMFNATFDKDFG